MKQLFSLVIAGMFGGLITFLGLQLGMKTNEPLSKAASSLQVSHVNVPPAPTGAPFDFTEAAAKATPAVVHISAIEAKQTASNRQPSSPLDLFFGENPFGMPFEDLYGPREGTGSGVIYSSDGYIVTNNHVVEFADKIEVTLYDNRKFAATIVGTDARADLAVLKIEGATNLPTLLLADSDRAKIGQWVLAVGNPLNLNSTVTAGIISAKGRDIDIIKGRDAIEAFIQTDAAVNPGNSGGALVDDEGRLLGINTAISTRTGYFQGYSFAIPVNIMTKIVDDIIEYGSFKRAYLGIGIFELDNEYAQENQLNIARGVVVDTVEDGGSAQFAGLLPKDVILEVEGRAIKTVVELQELVSRARVGEVITLTIHRDGENMEVPVRLKEG
jgi:serine protease Do